jgi:hypothetical protein
MKSVERHNLQANVVAHWLEVAIERYRPYLSKIITGAVAIVALFFIWSYISGSSAAQRSGAWDAFNQAVSSTTPNQLDLLKQTADEFQGTPVQQFADVTWADGQVARASDLYIYNRKAANEALNQAASAYRGVLQSSDNDRLLSRARLGLARVYEMQNELEKARNEYEQVAGTYAKYAKAQAERLAQPEAKETYAWLATAEAPRPVAPLGPGTPGKGPELFPSDIPLPGESNLTPGAGDGVGAAEAFDALLKEMKKETPASDKASDQADDRYKTDAPPAAAPGGAATDKDTSTEPPKGLLDSPGTGDAKTGEEKSAK